MAAPVPSPRVYRADRAFSCERLENRRLLSAGGPDLSFGNHGIVHLAFGASPASGFAVAVQGNGKIIAAGGIGTGTETSDFLLVRFRRDGALDPKFGAGGKVMTPFGGFDRALAVALAPDGKIVAAGINGFNDLILARYDRLGRLDPTFGAGGKIATGIHGFYTDRLGLAVQPNGKVVLAGDNYNQTASDFIVLRYTRRGNPDVKFGSNGEVTTTFADKAFARAMALAPDGKIVVTGDVGAKLGLARYDRHGRLDPTFGTGGKVVSPIGSFSVVNAVVVKPNGAVVVGGEENNRFFLAGYTRGGALDPAFGSAGVVTPDFGQTNTQFSQATSLVVENRKLVAAGTFANQLVLTRFSLSGRADLTFGQSGKVITAAAAPGAVSVDATPEGDLVTAGADAGDLVLGKFLGGVGRAGAWKQIEGARAQPSM